MSPLSGSLSIPKMSGSGRGRIKRGRERRGGVIDLLPLSPGFISRRRQSRHSARHVTAGGNLSL